jgi:hypothetical protein
MDKLQGLLEKMTADYTNLLATAEAEVNANMDKVKEECSAKQFEFIQNSLTAAKNGSLDVDAFTNKLKDFNNGC